MKKTVLSLICISTFAYAAESEKPALLAQDPPAYEDSDQGSSSQPAILDPVAELEAYERNYFLGPVNAGDAQEMIRRVEIYKDGDQNCAIKPNNIYAVAMAVLATAYDHDDGKAFWKVANTIKFINKNKSNLATRSAYVAHAAALGNQRALTEIQEPLADGTTIQASYDLRADTFAQVIKDREKYTSQQLYDFARTLLAGSDNVSPEPVRGIGIAVLLAKMRPNDWHGQKLLMEIAHGKTDRWKQYITPKDEHLAKKYALQVVALNGDAQSYAWLGCIQRQLGELTSAKASIEKALQKNPNYQWAKQEQEKIHKKLYPSKSTSCTIS